MRYKKNEKITIFAFHKNYTTQMEQIKSALISVFHKDGLLPILKSLANNGVKLYSTGGTHDFITLQGFECTPVETVTGYPSIFAGRVKTLHPGIMGGILMRRDHKEDLHQAEKYDIPQIDLVIVDLYPFEDTVASGASHEDIIEKIDIGGISLIRAAAKNYKDVVIIPSRSQYATLKEILDRQGAFTDIEQRRNLAARAFAVSSAYDSAIFNYFDKDSCSTLRLAIDGSKSLRYGENPHQKGRFFGDFNKMFDQLHGKEISYNNLLDIDSAVALIKEFNEPTFAILKHNNACGIACRENIGEAWEAALQCDPVSAFGGVLICNGRIDRNTAEKINSIFFEVIIAPTYDEEALEILKQKKNRIILLAKDLSVPAKRYRSALNGILEQDVDSQTETSADIKIVTSDKPSEQQTEDLLFANKIVKHSKSNAIVLARDRQLLASGIGQTSRVDALKQAIEKARLFNFDLEGSVMASDAFFPFADCVEIADKAGVKAVIHPGGSIRDKESVDYCENHGMVMAITGFRHFRH